MKQHKKIKNKNQKYRIKFKLENIDTNEQCISLDQICYFKGHPLLCRES